MKGMVRIMEKLIWYDARGIDPQDEVLLPLVFHSCIDVIVVTAEEKSNYKAPAKTRFVVQVEKESDLELLKKNDMVMSGSEIILTEAANRGHQTCVFLNVDNKESLDNAWMVGKKFNAVVIEFKDETNIPLELVIARLKGTNAVLLKKVHTAKEAEIAFGVMEKGSDGVMFATKDMNEMVEIKNSVERLQGQTIQMKTGKVTAIESVGMGERACIDTTSILKSNEGMIIGSTSCGGILVSSETHYLPYMNLRPFRVNAGAVHSYVWCPSDSTEYITDLKSGSRVLAVDHLGNAREVTVGRIKIERRPLLKITADVDGTEINTIVQDDWHIRVLGINGEPYNASCLTKGTELAAYICEAGRHVGIKIDEEIIEN